MGVFGVRREIARRSTRIDGATVTAPAGELLLPSAPALLAAALLCLAVGCALLAGLTVQFSPGAAPARTGAAARTGLLGLPLGAQGPVSAAVGADNGAYRVHESAGAFSAISPAERLEIGFTSSAVTVGAGATRVRLSLLGVGYGSSLTAIGAAPPRGHANRVEYAHPQLDEWYENGPLGLEQGFTLARAPAGHARGPLTLAIALSGNTHASLGTAGQSITLSHAGSRSLRYAGLVASDSRGRALRSWMSLRGGLVLLHVDSRGARYPLRIDPFVSQSEKLTGAGEGGEGEFGFSTTLSGDGDTALIGAPGDQEHSGAVWVFTRAGETWSQQGDKLTGSGESGEGEFGSGVALSASGDTALIGAPGDDGGVGAVWVFTRTGEAWSQQGNKLTGSGENRDGLFGKSVAVSADGDTALIGGPDDDRRTGAAWVFTRTGEAWSQQGEKLTGGESDESDEGEFGFSVALSAEGETALISAPGADRSIGAAWVFTRTGEAWSKQGGRLTGVGESGEGSFGRRVALSATGDTAFIGAPGDDGGVGAAWTFTRAGEAWSQLGEKLTSGETRKTFFGFSVALSADGETALVGGPGAFKRSGAVWAFTRSGESWSQQGTKFTGSTEAGKGLFGRRVALSGDGDTALVGGPGDDHAAGAAWVFAETTEPHAHWYSDERVIVQGSSESVGTSGKLTLELGDGSHVSCKATDTEAIENPPGAGAGVEEVKSFVLSRCKATETICPKRETLEVAAGGLPWKGELLAGPPVRDELSGVELTVECTKGSARAAFDALNGTLTPEVGDSVLQFGAGSGELSESRGAYATISGTDTLEGPKGDTHVTASAP